jgi:hypothetical protein
MAIEGSDYLATIGEPEGNSLTGVDYERDGVNLGGKKSQLGLPNMVQDFTQESSGAGISRRTDFVPMSLPISGKPHLRPD